MKNIARVQNCPDITTLNTIFGHGVRGVKNQDGEVGQGGCIQLPGQLKSFIKTFSEDENQEALSEMPSSDGMVAIVVAFDEELLRRVEASNLAA